MGGSVGGSTVQTWLVTATRSRDTRWPYLASVALKLEEVPAGSTLPSSWEWPEEGWAVGTVLGHGEG